MFDKRSAPANCLQYMTKSAGQIESFNFKQDYPAAVRQLADQNYNICFKRRTVIRKYLIILIKSSLNFSSKRISAIYLR